MAVQWYYKVMDQEAGPVSPSQLKELAESGFLTADVLVRKGAEGNWFPAGQVRGLFAGDPRVAASEEAARPAAPVTPPATPSPANEGNRPPAEAAPAPPPSQSQAAEVDWYCQVMGREIGPLSPSALEELAKEGFLSPSASIRRGTHGDWIPASEVIGRLGEGPPATPPQAAQSVAASPGAAPKPAAASDLASGAEVAAPKGQHDSPDKASAEPAPQRRQPAARCWYYEAMGEETGPLSPSQLKELAKSGLLTPDTPVRKGPDGPWVHARCVKGLFDKPPPAIAD